MIVGDRFAYATSRDALEAMVPFDAPTANLADAVDVALASGRRRDAETLLSLKAGAGTVSSGFAIDKALQPWDEGRAVVDVLADADADDALETDDRDFAGALGAPRDRVAIGAKRFDVLERPPDDAVFFGLLPPGAAPLPPSS